MSPKQMFFEIFTDRLDDTRNFFVDVIGFAVTRADEGFLVLQPGTAKLHVGSLDHMSLDQVDRIARSIQFWDDRKALDRRLAEAGFDPANPTVRRLLSLVQQLLGFPRHLSQHVGGFIMTRGCLDELVPVENAAMPERTVIQWEKDDLESLGLLKIDILALGMLSAIRKCFEYIRQVLFQSRQKCVHIPDEYTAVPQEFSTFHEDPGVFQVRFLCKCLYSF